MLRYFLILNLLFSLSFANKVEKIEEIGDVICKYVLPSYALGYAYYNDDLLTINGGGKLISSKPI